MDICKYYFEHLVCIFVCDSLQRWVVSAKLHYTYYNFLQNCTYMSCSFTESFNKLYSTMSKSQLTFLPLNCSISYRKKTHARVISSSSIFLSLCIQRTYSSKKIVKQQLSVDLSPTTVHASSIYTFYILPYHNFRISQSYKSCSTSFYLFLFVCSCER